jgi:hypothetical protein
LPEYETVIADETAHQIELRRLVLIYNHSCATHYPERLMIAPEMTLKHLNSEMTEIGPYTEALFLQVVKGDFHQPITLENMRKAHIGFQHLTGLLELSFNYTCMQRKFGWKYPETYLHPRYQGNLCDVALLLSDLTKLREFILRIKKEKGI